MPDFPQPIVRRPLGRAIRRNDAERGRAATITQADVVEARMMWHGTVPPGWAGLIEAKVETPKEPR